MCYLLRVHGILFQSKLILFCMFKKKKKKEEEEEEGKKRYMMKEKNDRIESIIKHKTIRITNVR